jgi:uncharacterized protein (DUF849 family)
MLIKAAINGGRTKAEHTAVPVSSEEQAAAVTDCLKAGASAIHLHVRTTSDAGKVELGRESLYAEDVTQTLSAVRAAVSGAAIGVSTGAWIIPDPAERLQAVADWKVQPDFASVNFSEAGAVELAKLFFSRGVAVEAGLIDSASARAFVASGLAANCLRVLIEPQEQQMKQALETVRTIEEALKSGGINRPTVLHGTEATAWPMLDEAMARGYDVRIGLEDTLVMPDGRVARDNVELVREAVRRSKQTVNSEQ